MVKGQTLFRYKYVLIVFVLPLADAFPCVLSAQEAKQPSSVLIPPEVRKFAALNSQALAKIDNCDVLLESRSLKGNGIAHKIRWRKRGLEERIDSTHEISGAIEGSRGHLEEAVFFDHRQKEMRYFAQRHLNSTDQQDSTTRELPVEMNFLPAQVAWDEGYEAWEAPHARNYIHHEAVGPLLLRICQVATDDFRTVEELVNESLGVSLEFEGEDPVLRILHPGINGEYVNEEVVVVLDSKNNYLARKVVTQSKVEGWQTIIEASSFVSGNDWVLPGFITASGGGMLNGKFETSSIREYQVTVNNSIGEPIDTSFRFPDQSIVKVLPSPVVMGGSTLPKRCDLHVYRDGKIEATVTPDNYKQFIADKLGVNVHEFEKTATSSDPAGALNQDSLLSPLWIGILMIVAVAIGVVAWRKNRT